MPASPPPTNSQSFRSTPSPRPAATGCSPTPGGKLVFHVFAALAEFERDLIRERTAAGLGAARARGRRGGRPSVLTAHKLQVAREMCGSGQYMVATFAKSLGVSRASIYRHLKRFASSGDMIGPVLAAWPD